MFLFNSKKLCQIWRTTRYSTIHLSFYLQNSSLKPLTCRSSTYRNSFTLFQLINPCCLSTDTALSSSKNVNLESSHTLFQNHGFTQTQISKLVTATKNVNLESSDRPDSVLTLFRNHGFTQTQISKIITTCPSLLLANPMKTLYPKFEFFYSIGISLPEFAKIVHSNQNLLRRSLKHHIMPCVDFLKRLLHTNEEAVAALKTGIFHQYKQKRMETNIAILRDHGVPESRISMLLATRPRALSQNPDRFIDIVIKVKEMRFDPLKSTFVLAINSLATMKESTWERKLEIYRGWGWSEEEILSAFRRQPMFMMTSEKKTMKVMDFLVNQMGFETSMITRNPSILLLSLEKRIFPRCLVIKFLQSKGLMDKEKVLSLSTILTPNDECFLENFVNKYLEKVPQLLKIYRGKMEFAKIGIHV